MVSDSSSTIINGRYQLHETLGQGGMGIVYRCIDRLTGSQLALKQVLTVVNSHSVPQGIPETAKFDATAKFSYLSTDSEIRLLLSQEFQTLASLRHPHIISVLDYGFDEQMQPYFTMPFLEDAQSLTKAAEKQPLERRLELIVDMLQALVYLHRRGIIHRDLKPDNVLVTSDGRVKVLDFGLAVLREQKEDDDYIAGTMPYMAPELLRGEGASIASDLFAVGMILYEVISGTHPFANRNVSQVMIAILTETPDVEMLDVSAELQNVVKRLIAFNPDERFPDAYAALESLVQTTSQNQTLETDEVRESFLQAARFVGRLSELKTLNVSLIEATRGHGSSWLIGGETGVGKSRLLDELRVRALINGVIVLRGQAIGDEDFAFQIWREPIRRLLLLTHIQDDETAILKPIIPDVDNLIGRSISTIDTKGSTSYLDQLKSVIAKIIRRQNRPVMLILEDLQWAEESIEILDTLNSMVGTLRILIVATYRTDENAALSEKLPGMKTMNLARLKREELLELSASMLGEGNHEKLVELLLKETEGNVLFLIEILRTLAQEAGHLGSVASMTLPRRVTAGGIDHILQNRLVRFTPDEQKMLQIMAIVGREVNTVLLNHLIGKEEAFRHSLDDWLAKCLNRGVLNLYDETWRFSHDRLRNLAIENQTEAETAQLHEKVAQGIEAVYPDADEQYAVLHYHWQAAGNLDRAVFYAVAAGDYSMKVNVFADAVVQYKQALALMPDKPEGKKLPSKSEVTLKLGEAQVQAAQYKDARKTLDSALINIDEKQSPLQVAQIHNWLANALWRLGEYEDAKESAQTCLRLAQKHSEAGLIASAYTRLGILALEQGDYSTAKEHYEKGLPHAIDGNSVEDQAALYNNLGIISSYEGNFDESSDYFQKSLNLARELGAQFRVTTTLMNLGNVAGMREDFDTSLHYFEDALELARSIGNRLAVSQLLGNLGYLTRLMKDFESARNYLNDSLKLAQSIGNRREIVHALINLGSVQVDMNEVDTARNYFIEGLREALAINAIPSMLEAIAELARLENDNTTKLQWLGHLLANNATKKEQKDLAQAMLDKLSERLDATDIEQQIQSGAERATNQIAETILNDYKESRI